MLKIGAVTARSTTIKDSVVELHIGVHSQEGKSTSMEVLSKSLSFVECKYLIYALTEIMDGYVRCEIGLLHETELAEAPDKQKVLEWLQENNWGSDHPPHKVWLFQTVLNASPHDNKISISAESGLGVLLNQLPEDHIVLEYFIVLED